MVLAADSLIGLLGGSPREPRSDPPIPRSPAEWSAVVDEALRQGLAPLLHRRVRSLDPPVAPPAECVERLQVAYCHNALRQQTMRTELRRVLLALRRDDVRVVLLKGAHLAEGVYGDPALRPMADIDLLVAPADLARVERVLTSAGYSTTSHPARGTDYATHQHIHPFHKGDALPIEVHRGIVPTDAPFDIDLAALWSRVRPSRVADVDSLVLSPEDLLQHLCLHVAYTHRFDVPLLALHDIRAAIDRRGAEIDWSRLAATANRDGTSSVVFCALSLVQATFGAVIPTDALAAIDHLPGDAEVVRAARDVLLAGRGVELPLAYGALRGADGLVARTRVVVRAIWPPRERMKVIYDLAPRSPAVYAYYALRPFDLVRRRGRIVGAMLLGRQRVRPALAREEARRIVDRWIDRVSNTSGAAGR